MIEGKLANQFPRNSKWGYTLCCKCSKLIPRPEIIILKTGDDRSHYLHSYLHDEYFIYETKSGRSATYCSKYCRNKHNHRHSGSK